MARTGYDDSLEKINNLVKGYYVDKKIPEEAYNTNLQALETQKAKYKKILDGADERVDEWIAKTEKVFNFAITAKERFEHGDLSIKNSILFNLGVNVVIKDRRVSIDIDKPLKIIQKAKPQMKSILDSLEPQGKPVSMEDVKILLSKNVKWGSLLDIFRTRFPNFNISTEQFQIFFQNFGLIPLSI